MARTISTNLGRNALLLAATSAGSYLFGVLRDRLLANTYGASREVDIFNSAFILPDLIMNLFAAAITTAFIPVLAKARDGERAANHMLTVIVVCMLGLASVAYLLMPWLAGLIAPGFNASELVQLTRSSRTLLLSPLLFSVSILLGAVLQGKHHFLAYALSPMVYNIGICVGILWLTPITGVIIGAGLHLGIRLLAVLRLKYIPRLQWAAFGSPDVHVTLRLIGPRIVGLMAVQASLWTYNSVGSTLEAGSVAIFNFARNFQSLPVSFIGITIATVLFPILAADFAAAEPHRLLRNAKRALLTIIGLSLPAMVLMMLVSERLISLLLGGGSFTASDIHTTALVLIVMSLAIPLESCQHILARIYYAQHNTKRPAVIGVIGAIVNVVVCLVAARQYGVLGLAVGFVVMTALIDGLLLWPLRYQLMNKLTLKIMVVVTLAIGLGLAGLVAWQQRLAIQAWIAARRTPAVPVAVTYDEIEDELRITNDELREDSVETPADTSDDVQAIQELPLVEIPDEYNLDIPFTSQAPFANWDAVHEETCEEASILMAARFLQSRSLGDASTADAAMLELVSIEENQFGYGVSITAEQTAEVVEYVYPELTAEVIYDFTWDDVKRAIAQGYPVIVPAAGRELGNPNFTAPGPLYHMLVIKGYTPEYVITNDPGTRKGADYTYSYDILYNAIHDWNEGNVTAGQKAIIIVHP